MIALSKEGIMPAEVIVVVAFVGLLFLVFAAGLAYADFQTRNYRD